jgi:hypothetical protein
MDIRTRCAFYERFTYEYNFFDAWLFDIRFEKIPYRHFWPRHCGEVILGSDGAGPMGG